MKNQKGQALVAVLVLAGLICAVCATAIPSCRAAWNRYAADLRKVDDATTYETTRSVEDNCRAMQAAYRSDLANARVYAASGHKEWAESLLVRVNRTAATYNEYVRRNNFVWRGNVPSDIDAELPMVTADKLSN